jgi:hypothetical protein
MPPFSTRREPPVCPKARWERIATSAATSPRSSSSASCASCASLRAR